MASMTYVAYKACGCLVAACVDAPAYRRDTAKSVGDFLRRGYRVERVPSDRVRQMFLDCPHGKPAPRR